MRDACNSAAPTSSASLTLVPASSTVRPSPNANAGPTSPCTAEVSRLARRSASHSPRPNANSVPSATQAMDRYRFVVTKVMGAPAATVHPDSDERLKAV
ncbi:hypothetical protein D3C73_1019620 [compost metagenome]